MKMSLQSGSSASTNPSIDIRNSKAYEAQNGFDMNSGPSYDVYDDFPLGNYASGSGGGGVHQKRNKNHQSQIYSSKHTRLRENRISSSKPRSPQRQINSTDV